MSTTEVVSGSVPSKEALYRLLQRHQLYELVDPLIADPGFGDAQGWHECACIPNPFFDHPRAQCLRLQPVKGSPPTIWEKLQAHRQPPLPKPDAPRPVCGWLIAQQPMASIARYLNRQLLQRKPSGRNALLRYYDPRVMLRLAAILSGPQLSTLLGPVAHWLVMDHTGEMRVISPHGDSRRLNSLSLDDEQWRAIERIGLVNRTLALCATLTDSQALDDEAVTDIDRLLAVAGSEGLADPAARMTFALHGLGRHAHFYRHPEVQRVLTRCREGEDYQRLTADWNHETWQRIAADTREAQV
ncbi:DUF4123 domain-containing protein [Halomonas mongoliensis]|uniref:DUF4123 domain-containing protein n=1 Tax=Halomonas mongoliensis TaxID=321265 RepID=UPI00403B0E53